MGRTEMERALPGIRVASTLSAFLFACLTTLTTSVFAQTEEIEDDDVDDGLTPKAALREEAREEGQIRLYSTRSERREAGLQRQITPWLTFSGLLELEAIGEQFKYRSGIEDGERLDPERESETVANVQLGFIAKPFDWLEAELILEYDSEPNEVFVEEAILAADVGDFELSIGRQYLPFGQYYSNFVTGPILELGETQEDAITLTWDWEDRIEISASLYEGIARSANKDDNGLDWAFALNAVPHERVGLGVSYLKDLGDADGRLLEDFDNQFTRKVAGLGAYAIYIGDGFETTFEVVAAESSFRELDADRDKPFAWNWELALFIDPRAELNFRIEGSEQIEGFPESQWGLAATILLHPRATLTLEFLEGSYRRGLATDDDDNPFRRVSKIGGQIAIAF